MMPKKRMTRRKFARRFLKDISWIMSKDIPYLGWYDLERDNINLILDVFLKDMWKNFLEENWEDMLAFMVGNLNLVFLHEYIHWMAEPAGEKRVVWRFPKGLTVQDMTERIEGAVDCAATLLSDIPQSGFPSFVGGEVLRIPVIYLKSCARCEGCEVKGWCKK